MATHTSIEYFASLTLQELLDVAEEIQEVNRTVGKQ